MTCEACQQGIVPFVAADNPKPDTEIEPGDLLFAVCLCPAGQALRSNENHHRTVAPLWRAWCAREQIDPARVFMIESVYTAAELAAAGLTSAPTELSREAALLAPVQGRRR